VTPWLLPLLFGADFAPAVPVALVLLLAFLPRGLREIIAFGLRGLDQVRPATVAELLSIAVFLAGVWPLAGWLGLSGVGAALLLAHLAGLLYLGRHLERALGLPPRAWWGIDRSTCSELLGLARSRLAALRPPAGGERAS
jgi:O-antigen/teichoic acid export membrane protein